MGEPRSLTAVDFLLEPDATMLERAAAANDRLRAVYPDGFALDALHRPHITMVQGYFPTDRLDEIFAAAKIVLDREPIASWPLRAFAYYYLPLEGIGLAGIVVEPSEVLVGLQRKLLDALAPFTATGGSADAFAKTADEPEINDAGIAYTEVFEAVAAGANFNPHVTIGISTRAHLDEMLAEQFDEFSFSTVGAAAYQLGNFGTAAKQLRRWEVQR